MLLFLFFPSLALADIVYPLDREVFTSDEVSVVELELDSAEDCELYGRDLTAGAFDSTPDDTIASGDFSSGKVTLTLTADRAYKVVCGSDSVTFSVRDDLHPTLLVGDDGRAALTDTWNVGGTATSDWDYTDTAPDFGCEYSDSDDLSERLDAALGVGSGTPYLDASGDVDLSWKIPCIWEKAVEKVGDYEYDGYDVIDDVDTSKHVSTIRERIQRRAVVAWVADAEGDTATAEALAAQAYAELTPLLEMEDWTNAVLDGSEWSVTYINDAGDDIILCSDPEGYFTGTSCSTASASTAATAAELVGLTPTSSGSMSDSTRALLIQTLAFAYDWLFDELEIDERRAIREKLDAETWAFYEDKKVTKLVDERWDEDDWSLAYGHNTFTVQAVAASLYARIGELSDETQWTYDSGSLSHHDLLDLIEDYIAMVVSFGETSSSLGEVPRHSDGIIPFGHMYAWDHLTDQHHLIEMYGAAYGGDTSFYDDFGLLRNSPLYWLHFTHPGGEAVLIEDHQKTHHNNTEIAALMGRLAAVYDSDDPDMAALAQRIAWLSADAKHVEDLLWWNSDVTPLTSEDLDARSRHHHFTDSDQVSLRSSWDSDALHLIYKGSMTLGVHEQPAAGSIVMAQGEYMLVSDIGHSGNAYKRTAGHTTLLIDGQGQHGDGKSMTPAPLPDSAGPGIFAFLDLSERDLDVVSFGHDLRGMYQHDEVGADNLPSFNLTDVDDLFSLERYTVWLGGEAVLLLDRVISGTSMEIEWQLNGIPYADDGAGYERDTCAIDDFTGADGVEGDLTFSNGLSGYDPMNKWLAVDALNTGELEPNLSDPSSCTDPFTLDGTEATLVPYDGLASVNLLVSALEAGAEDFDTRMTVYEQGSAVVGHHLHRTMSHSGSGADFFLTALMPHSTLAGGIAATASTVGGQGVSAELSSTTVDVLIADEGFDVEDTALGVEVEGAMGVVAWEDDTRAAVWSAHLHRGKVLRVDGQLVLGLAGNGGVPLSAAMMYTDSSTITVTVSGIEEGETGQVTVALPTGAAVDSVSGVSTYTDTTTQVALFPEEDGTITITLR